MYADHVSCSYCEKEMFVERGADICPSCLHKAGTLMWANIEEPEIELSFGLFQKLEKDSFVEVTSDLKEFYGL
jgi:hypothetical protein